MNINTINKASLRKAKLIVHNTQVIHYKQFIPKSLEITRIGKNRNTTPEEPPTLGFFIVSISHNANFLIQTTQNKQHMKNENKRYTEVVKQLADHYDKKLITEILHQFLTKTGYRSCRLTTNRSDNMTQDLLSLFEVIAMKYDGAPSYFLALPTTSNLYKFLQNNFPKDHNVWSYLTTSEETIEEGIEI